MSLSEGTATEFLKFAEMLFLPFLVSKYIMSFLFIYGWAWIDKVKTRLPWRQGGCDVV